MRKSASIFGTELKSVPQVSCNPWVAQPKPAGRWKAPGDGASVRLLRHLRDQEACDLYDVLAELAYGAAARSRAERAASFAYKQRQWLKGLPGKAEQVLYAMARQFERGGIEELETTNVFDAEEVKGAGGFNALKALRLSPGDLIIETKMRLLAP